MLDCDAWVGTEESSMKVCSRLARVVGVRIGVLPVEMVVTG